MLLIVLYSGFERHRSVDQTESETVLRSVYYVRVMYRTYIHSIHRGLITRWYIAYGYACNGYYYCSHCYNRNSVALYYVMFIYTTALSFHILFYELTPKCHCGATC